MSKINILDLDPVMLNNTTLMRILEDGIVSEHEIAEQVEKVNAVAEKIQQVCTDEQLEMIQTLIAEMNTLYVAYNYNELLSIR